MGKAKKRVNPTIKNRINRKLKALAMEVIWGLVSKLPEPYKTNPNGHVGRPSYPAKQMAAICTYQAEFDIKYEDMESELDSSKRLLQILGLKELPRHSTIHDASKKLPMWYIRAVSQHIASGYEARNLGFDSTGFGLRDSSAWYDIRIGKERKKKDFLKLHMVENLDNGLIMDFRITDGKAHDCPLFKGLIKPFKSLNIVVADKGYLSMKNCKLVAEREGMPFIMPKKNSRGEARHPKAWKSMIRWFKKRKEEWMSIYHMRSAVESLFSSVKRRLGDCVRAVKKKMQRKELALKVVAYNLRQMLYIEGGEYFGLPFWVEA